MCCALSWQLFDRHIRKKMINRLWCLLIFPLCANFLHPARTISTYIWKLYRLELSDSLQTTIDGKVDTLISGMTTPIGWCYTSFELNITYSKYKVNIIYMDMDNLTCKCYLLQCVIVIITLVILYLINLLLVMVILFSRPFLKLQFLQFVDTL